MKYSSMGLLCPYADHHRPAPAPETPSSPPTSPAPAPETPSTLLEPEPAPEPEAPAAPVAPGTERALLVGINYTGQDGQLRGCANDVLDMWRFLAARDVECVILCDEEPEEGWPSSAPPRGAPTKAAMRREMAALSAWTRWNPRARCWFHFSGHGGQVRDWDGDESDGKDECLIPVDYKTKGVLRDDEIATVLKKNLAPDASLVAVVDACHSGTMFEFDHVYDNADTQAYDVVPQHVSISGCRDDQTSADAQFGDRWGGALTRALLPILRRGEARCGPIRDELHLMLHHFEQRPEVRASSPLGSSSILPNL